jgi:hypothetical protein
VNALSDYITLKKSMPNKDLAPGTGIFDEMWVNRVMLRLSEVAPFGIDEAAMFGILEGKQNKVDFIALKVLEAVDQARQAGVKQLRAPQNSHIMPRELCEYLISFCLLSSWEHRHRINWCLTSAAIELLGGVDERDAKRISPNVHRYQAIVGAAEMMARGEKVSARAVAKSMGVAPTTVTRLFPGDSLVKLARQFRRNERS